MGLVKKELAKELSAGRIGSAGLIFVDAQGNEVGGLAYSAAVRPDGTYSAGSSFTFDQHNQDQVIGFQYDDSGSRRAYGLSVWDRPTKVTIAEMLDAAKGAPDREARHKQFAELLKARGDVSGSRRIFLGSENRTAALRLADAAGRERVRISVDDSSAARMEFLDESGKVIYALHARFDSPRAPARKYPVMPRILVVDDDGFLAALIAKALEGYEVTVARDGGEALHAVEHHAVLDLIITDYLMPEMTGDELLGRLRERRPDLKALVVSGHGDILDRELPDWWRREAHLAKPFTLAALRDAVERLIGPARSTAERRA